MHNLRSRPRVALATLLLSVLPLQLSVVAPLSMGADMARVAVPGPSEHDEPFPPASAAHPAEMPADEMPCGEGRLCETGLMYCSAAGAICTLLFFSPAEDPSHAVQTTSVQDGWRSEATPVLVDAGHRTPPPRA